MTGRVKYEEGSAYCWLVEMTHDDQPLKNRVCASI